MVSYCQWRVFLTLKDRGDASGWIRLNPWISLIQIIPTYLNDSFLAMLDYIDQLALKKKNTVFWRKKYISIHSLSNNQSLCTILCVLMYISLRNKQEFQHNLLHQNVLKVQHVVSVSRSSCLFLSERGWRAFQSWPLHYSSFSSEWNWTDKIVTNKLKTHYFQISFAFFFLFHMLCGNQGHSKATHPNQEPGTLSENLFKSVLYNCMNRMQL